MRTATKGSESKKAGGRRGWMSFRSLMRTRITAGLILVLPIWITYSLITFVFGLMRDASLWVVEGVLASPVAARVVEFWMGGTEAGEAASRPAGGTLLDLWGVPRSALTTEGLATLPPGLRWGIGIASVLLTVMLLYTIGLVTSNIVGRRLVTAVETLVDRVPFVKAVYRASKQVLEMFAGESAQGFQRVVLVPFPSSEVRSVGFVTRIFRDAGTGEEFCAVFVSTTPNPTTGFVFLIKRAEVVELDWTIEEAIKVVMSGGVLTPATVVIPSSSAGPQPAPLPLVAAARAAQHHPEEFHRKE